MYIILIIIFKKKPNSISRTAGPVFLSCRQTCKIDGVFSFLQTPDSSKPEQVPIPYPSVAYQHYKSMGRIISLPEWMEVRVGWTFDFLLNQVHVYPWHNCIAEKGCGLQTGMTKDITFILYLFFLKACCGLDSQSELSPDQYLFKIKIIVSSVLLFFHLHCSLTD